MLPESISGLVRIETDKQMLVFGSQKVRRHPRLLLDRRRASDTEMMLMMMLRTFVGRRKGVIGKGIVPSAAL